MAQHLSNMFGSLPSMFPLGYSGSMPFSAVSARCFPGDTCWPNTVQWDHFNSTVGGKLIASIPIAAVCHDTQYETYNADECEALKDNWFFPETHLPSSSSAMAPIFTNDSCSPFQPRQSPCTLGNYVNYAVEVLDETDIQKTIAMANEHNIRLVIRATGHDYNGKSTGAGGLAIWTHKLKSIELNSNYESPLYTGRAVKLGAGVHSIEAYEFADANHGIIVGGNCPTVALAGGFTQGGGHGPLATAFGLASDQVLEWEVVTTTGEVLTATPTQNEDLYFALCGGGGGTYGIVTSMTVKFHSPMPVAAAKLSFAIPGAESGTENFWAAITTFVASLPDMVDSGLQVIWMAVPGALIVSPATGFGISKEKIDEVFKPTLSHLEAANIPYQYQSESFSTYLQSYKNMNLPSANVSNAILGSHLLPRSAATSNLAAFISTVREIISKNFIFVGLALNVTAAPSQSVAVNPYWRKTLIAGVLGTSYDYEDFEANFRNQKIMTQELIPKLAKLTPDGGAAYLNEADFMQPNWQSAFYGKEYQRLQAVKWNYDPEDRLYALGAVGSERWIQRADGRLVRS